MPDAYLSFALQDLEFTQRLRYALVTAGRDALMINVEIGTMAGNFWRSEISDGIHASNKFIFVISPDSLSSQSCLEELAQAVSVNKPIIPLLRRQADVNAMPRAIAERNWIIFENDSTFDRSFSQLLSALDTDLDWVATHSRLSVRAREWVENGSDRSYLLRGTNLRAAERWLADSGNHPEAPPTNMQVQYINASQQHERRAIRLRRTAVSMPGTVVLERPTIVRVTESPDRRTESIGDEVRSFNNTKSSSTAVETIRVSNTTRVSTSVDLSKTSTLSGSAGVSFVDVASAKASLSNDLTRHYSLKMDSEISHEQTTQINIPAHTNVEITFHWFRIWVAGTLTLSDLAKPAAEVAQVPFEITVGLTFNKETRDID